MTRRQRHERGARGDGRDTCLIVTNRGVRHHDICAPLRRAAAIQVAKATGDPDAARRLFRTRSAARHLFRIRSAARRLFRTRSAARRLF